MATKNRLGELREAEGWDREDLADSLGVSKRTIERWESGETGIPDRRKAELSHIFGVSISYLMGWSDEL
jgi:transcriptional regulator with XRE-family HTH domain